MAEVFLTRRAIMDIDEIRRYSIDQWGERIASEYLADIDQALHLLRENPGLLRSKDEASTRLWFHRVRRHFLVCDVIGGDVYVLTVKHGALDLPNRIAELEPTLMREAGLMHERVLKARGGPSST